MLEHIRYTKITTQEQLDTLKRFSATFNHSVDKAIHPIYMIHRGYQLIGYFCLPLLPVFFPAFHPDKVTPRDFLEVCQQVRATACLTSMNDQFPNGQCWLAVEKEPSIPRD